MTEEKSLFVEKKLTRWRRLGAPNPGCAFVFTGEDDSLVVYPQQGERGPTHGELLWGKYSTCYEVDMGDRLLEFHEKLPCADSLEFEAEVRLTYKVSDPALILSRARADAGQFLKDSAVSAMRQTSRKFKYEKCGDAEDAVAACIKKEVHDNGFELARPAFVKLSLDASTQEFLSKKVEFERQDELEGLKQEAKFALKGKRAEILGPLIEEGNWRKLLAILDPADPEDEGLRQIFTTVFESEQKQEAEQRKLLNTLIEKKVLEGWEMEGVAKSLLQNISGFSDNHFNLLEQSVQKKSAPEKKEQGTLDSPPIPDEISRNQDD